MRWVTNTVNLAAAAVFTAMGGMVLWLAATGESTATPGDQLAIGQVLADVLTRIDGWVAPIPEPLLGAGLLALAGRFAIGGRRDRRHDEEAACPTPGTHPPQAQRRVGARHERGRILSPPR